MSRIWNEQTKLEALEGALKKIKKGIVNFGFFDRPTPDEAWAIQDALEKQIFIEGKADRTNADRIRCMPNWQLAEFIYNVSNGATKISVCEEECAKCECDDGYCIMEIGEWLRKEVEE